MRVPRYLLRTEVTIEPYAGESGRGPTYGAAVTTRGHWEGKRRLYVDPDGRQALSESTLLLDLDEIVPLETKVTKGGTEYRVVSVVTHDAGIGTPGHLEVMLAPSRRTGGGLGG